MQPDPSKIRALLKKTSHHDPDERFMATSDLQSELEKVDGQLDSSLQTPIRDAILKQLDDTSNDVRTVACKCLCSVVQKFNIEQVEEITDKLGKLLVDGKFELRDIYTIAIKNIISSVPEEYGQQIAKLLVKRLLQGLRKIVEPTDTDEEAQEEERNHFNRQIACLDILKSLNVRFGFVMAADHQSILDTIQPLLNNNQVDIRKKVAQTLGTTVAVVNDEQFNALMGNIVNQISNIDFHDEKLFTFIQAVGIFSRNAGQRISHYLKDIVPLLIKICTDTGVNEDSSEASIELRENCLQTFDVMIVQCPAQMMEHTEALMEVGLSLMTFDPNWDYSQFEDDGKDNIDEDGDTEYDDEDDDFGDDDDEWGDDNDDDGGGGGGGDGDGGDDGWDNTTGMEAAADDDPSWKVRRAAVKMLTSFIQTHKSTVLEFHIAICDQLLERFKEHDTTVRLEIFSAFRELLLASIIAEQGHGGFHSNENNPFEMPPLLRQVSTFQIMSQKLPVIMKQVCSQFLSPTANAAVKNGLLGIVRDLVLVRQAQRSERCDYLGDEGLSQYFDALIPSIISCIQDSDIQLKTRSLYVLYLILQRHRYVDSLKILPIICPVVVDAVSTNYSRVKTRALLTLGRMNEIIRPFTNNQLEWHSSLYSKLVVDIFNSSFGQLSVKDIEGEVKKAALTATAISIAHFGDILSNEVSKTLDVLIDRLSNEVTRQTSLQCFATICRSPLNIDLSSICDQLVQNMCSFLKKHATGLRVDTAQTLSALLSSNNGITGRAINDTLKEQLIQQCSEFINDNDLHLCSLILNVLCIMLEVCDKNSAQMITKFILPKTFIFLQSPLLQGSALHSLKQLFATYVEQTAGKLLSVEQLKNEFIHCAAPKLSRSAYSAISQCMSVLIVQLDDKQTIDRMVAELVHLIDSKNDNHSQVALLCIGEMGKSSCDLSHHQNIENKTFVAFSRESEAVKWAASFALGNIAIGNMSKYVPALLSMIETHPDRQYLLLNSLKEIISFHSNSPELMNRLVPFSDTITPLLLINASSVDEGVRAMIAECLGKFAVIDQKIFAHIEKRLISDSSTTRATMATAVKYGLNKSTNYELPASTVNSFLSLLKDEDLSVKRQAFLTVNSILHVNCQLIAAHMSMILPLIYQSTITDASLIREVDLGPFKHRVDDGLPLRKSAFQCMDTLVDSTPHKIDLFEFVSFLKNGLTDESPDIQMLTYQILCRLGNFHGPRIIGALDTLPNALMKGIKRKMNETKGKKDAERARDILRAACKALYTLKSIANANKARKFLTFYSRVEKTKILIPMLAEIARNSKKKR